MKDAVAELRAELRAPANAYLDALEAGRVSEAALGAFAAEQHAIISSDRRSFAQLAARFPGEPFGSFFLDLAAGEGEALALLGGFARSVGLDDPEAHEPIAGCRAYPAFVAWLALNGSPADVALAFLVNLEAWGESCARMAAALRGRYDVAFFDFFATPPPGFEERALAVAAAGGDLRQAARAARVLNAFELLYWDSLPLA